MFIVISYDITSNKKRIKLADILIELGMFRVQKSVFEGDLSQKKILKIKEFGTSNLEKNDSIRYYPLGNCCAIRSEVQTRNGIKVG